MNNYPSRTFWLTLLVIVALLVQYKLPTPTLETGLIKKWLGMKYDPDEYLAMRKVDLLSDLRIEKEDLEDDDTDLELLAQLKNNNPKEIQVVVVEDSTIASIDSAASAVYDSLRPKPIHIVFNDTVHSQEGTIEIVDYDDGTGMGIERFYAALDHVKERPVRIGFFGDSFIEGDIMTGWLRSMMQSEWGGKGVGYIEIAPETAGFRTTVLHRHSGWAMHQWLNKRTFQKNKQSISCHYFTAKGKAWVEGRCSKFKGAQDFDKTSFYFKARQSDKIKLVANDSTFHFDCQKADTIQTLTYQSQTPLTKARWELETQDTASIFYGMAMDGNTGIILDNISMRGQSGTQLGGVPIDHLKSMHKVRKYDLIVLQFGLNVASPNCTKFTKYQQDMEQVVRHLHEAYPEAGFLIISVGDRRYKHDGRMVTMPGVKHLCLYQQSLAAQTKTSYWNMLDAMLQMGGIDSMANAKPSLANMDYTHINFRGGKQVATKLFEAIKAGKDHYDRKQAYIQGLKKE